MNIGRDAAAPGENAIDHTFEKTEVFIFAGNLQNGLVGGDDVTVVQGFDNQVFRFDGKGVNEGDDFIQSAHHRLFRPLKKLHGDDVMGIMLFDDIAGFQKIIRGIKSASKALIKSKCPVGQTRDFTLFF